MVAVQSPWRNRMCLSCHSSGCYDDYPLSHIARLFVLSFVHNFFMLHELEFRKVCVSQMPSYQHDWDASIWRIWYIRSKRNCRLWYGSFGVIFSQDVDYFQQNRVFLIVCVNFFRNHFKFCPNFTFNLRFKFTDCLFHCITFPSLLVSRHLSFFDSLVFIEVLLSLVVFWYLWP